MGEEHEVTLILLLVNEEEIVETKRSIKRKRFKELEKGSFFITNITDTF